MTVKTFFLAVMLLAPVASSARIHEGCHTDNEGSRVFAIAYTGAVIDLKTDITVDGSKVYQTPAMNYEQAFSEVCKVVDEHPELWNRPSREAITFAVDVLWKKK